MYSDHVLLLYGSSSVPFDRFITIVDSGMQEFFSSYSSIKYRDAQLAIRPGSERRKEYLRLPTWLKIIAAKGIALNRETVSSLITVAFCQPSETASDLSTLGLWNS
jgi:hypothetical protein